MKIERKYGIYISLTLLIKAYEILRDYFKEMSQNDLIYKDNPVMNYINLQIHIKKMQLKLEYRGYI